MDAEPALLPFTDEAKTYVQRQGHGLRDLVEEDRFYDVRERAEERVLQALRGGAEEPFLRNEEDVAREALSYPLARVLVSCVGERFLARVFAEAEAGRSARSVDRHLDRLRDLGHDVDPDARDAAVPTYLELSGGLAGDEWRLVNRAVDRGRVPLAEDEAARLFGQAARARIGENLPLQVDPDLCDLLSDRVETVREELESRTTSVEDLEMDESCFPPCVDHLLERIRRGENLTHTARFAITSFLLTLGETADEVVDMFDTSPDFDEEKTRYQVEHIAGSTGESYTPPSCQTMKTYGNCPGEDRRCKADTVTHPLSYYRWALKDRDDSDDGEDLGGEDE